MAINKLKTYVTFWLRIKTIDDARKLSRELGYNLSAVIDIMLRNWVKYKKKEKMPTNIAGDTVIKKEEEQKKK